MSYQALLFCPDEKTARVVTQVLTDLDFTVEAAAEPFAAVKKLMAQHFDALVVDCENEQNAALLFKSARNSSSNQASLAVAVVEGQAGVAKAFRIGANLVLTKPINVEQSKGTLRVARGLLRKGAEPGKPAEPAKPAPTQVPEKPEAAVPSSAPRPQSSLSTGMPAAPTQARSTVAFTPKPAPVPVTPAASIAPGTLEKDPEITVEPDESEAAVLESMHDPLPAPTAPSANVKPSPVAPPSMPTMRSQSVSPSPLSRASSSSAAGDPPASSGTAPKPVAVKPVAHTLVTPISSGHSGQGAAAAPARSKEPVPQTKPADGQVDLIALIESKPASTEKPAEKAPALAPMASSPFSTLDSRDSAEHSGGSKTPLIAAAAVVVICVGSYFGWRAFHGQATQPKPAAVQASAPQPAAAGALAEAPVVADATVTAPAPAPQTPSEAKPSASATAKATTPTPKSATHETIAEDKTVTIANSEPMTVKKDSAHPRPAAEGDDQAAAPAPLGIGSGAEDKALMSVTNAPVAVPRAAPHMVNISQGISTGLLLKRVQPVYPSQALTMRIEGAVDMQATITKDGNITNLKVVSGQPLLARAAVDAVRQWKYKPYFLDGQPVDVQTQITVKFKLPN